MGRPVVDGRPADPTPGPPAIAPGLFGRGLPTQFGNTTAGTFEYTRVHRFRGLGRLDTAVRIVVAPSSRHGYYHEFPVGVRTVHTAEGTHGRLFGRSHVAHISPCRIPQKRHLPDAGK